MGATQRLSRWNILKNRGPIGVPPFDDYDLAKFFDVNGVNEFGVTIYRQANVVALVKRALAEANDAASRWVQGWETIAWASEEDIIRVYTPVFQGIVGLRRAFRVLASLVRQQATGGAGSLFVNGYANVVHVTIDDEVYWLSVRWCVDLRCWAFDADRVVSGRGCGWAAESLFLSDVSADEALSSVTE